MTKELLEALEAWERDGAREGMEGRQAPGGTRTARLLETYRTYRARPQGRWRAEEGNPGTGWWLGCTVDGFRRERMGGLDQRTAEVYARALNEADAELEAR